MGKTTASAEAIGAAADGVRETERLFRWTLLAAALTLSALATWLISPRFAFDLPSLVDDWSAVSRSPDQLADILRLTNPETQRFRPSWILWNYVQWHTFDAPDGLVGPNVWNVLRTVVLVTGLILATALAMPAPKTRTEAVLRALLAATPVLMILTIPKFAPELARFGVQEPLLVGGIALGGSLLVLAARAVLDGRATPAWRVVVLAFVGGAFWVVGVYQKEASLAVVPLLVATAIAGRGRIARVRPLRRGQRAALVTIGIVAVIPLVHVAVEVVRIATRGDLVYDAEVDAGRGIVRGFEVLWDWVPEVFPHQAQRLVLAAVLLAAIVAIVRRRVDALVVGALASGVLVVLFAAQSGVAASRYFIPVYALAAVALVLSVARLPTIGQVAFLLMVVALSLSFVSEARYEVREWATFEDEGASLVRAVSKARASGCPVAVAGLDGESRAALPVLVTLLGEPVVSSCVRGATYLVIRSSDEGAALARACVDDELGALLDLRLADVYRCARLETRHVRDPMFGLVSPAMLVQLRGLETEPAA